MLTNFQNQLALLGRIMLSIIFITSGASKIGGFQGTIGYITSHGLPLPALAAVIAIVVELGGGLALLFGYQTRWAALAIAVFTIVAAVFFHNFWAVPAEQVMNTTIHFWKNVSIAGGLLMVAAFGPGLISVDARSGPPAARRSSLA